MMDAIEIQQVLPHRYPFLLVDRVLELEPGKRAVGLKNVTVNEDFFNGHFPGNPIMPGVLIVEAMAQVGGILLSRETWSLVRDQVMTEAGDELSIKGFAHPVQTYRVVGSYSAMEAEDRILRLSREGISIVVDKARLTDEALEAAVDALRQAGAESARALHRDPDR